MAEYYADCFGELETESDESSEDEAGVGESTAVSGMAKQGDVGVEPTANPQATK